MLASKRRAAIQFGLHIINFKLGDSPFSLNSNLFILMYVVCTLISSQYRAKKCPYISNSWKKSNKNPQNIQTNRQYQTLQICKHGDYREHNFRYYIDILVVIFVTYEIYMCTSFVIFCTFLVFHYHFQSSKVRNPIEPKERTPPF